MGGRLRGGRAFVRARRVNDESSILQGRTKVVRSSVTEGVAQGCVDGVIHVGEGRNLLNGGDNLLDDGVGDCRDVIPSEWGSRKGEARDGIVGSTNCEREVMLEFRGENEGPVKILDVGAMEIYWESGSEEWFECFKVGEGERFGVPWPKLVDVDGIEYGTKLGGAAFWPNKEISARRGGGWLSTPEVEKVSCHVPETRGKFWE